jgi:hypothetical protein
VIIVPQVLNTARTSDMRNNVTNQPSTTAQADTGAAAALSTTPCPDEPLAIPDDLSGQRISEDALSIRLCPTTGGGDWGLPVWVPPTDALLPGSVGGFLDTVMREPEASEDRCDAIRVIPDPYVLLIGMPNGTVDKVFSTSSCSDILVGSTEYRSGADTVLDSFLTVLGAQRRSLAPPVSAPEPPVQCSADFDASQASPVPVTRGPTLTLQSLFSDLVLCENADAVKRNVSAFNEAFPGSSRDLSTGPPDELDLCPNADIVWTGGYAVTVWGDVVSLEFHGCRDYFLGHWAITDNGGVAREIQFLPDPDTASQLGLP